MDWSKFLSREFLVSLTLIVIATIAMFTGVCNFNEWAMACGGFAGWWMGMLTVQKWKNGSTPAAPAEPAKTE